MASAVLKGSNLALAVALIAAILAISALGLQYVGSNSLQSQVNSLQSGQSRLVQNSAPASRNITIEWGIFNSGQNRFFPDYVIVNQGDKINLTFINNDTIYAHTFTANVSTTDCPTSSGVCEYQINASAPGLASFLTGEQFTTDPTNCLVASTDVPCTNLVAGGAGNLTGSISFTVTQPGIFRYYSVYDQSGGMFGYIVVLPNAGYKP